MTDSSPERQTLLPDLPSLRVGLHLRESRWRDGEEIDDILPPIIKDQKKVPAAPKAY